MEPRRVALLVASYQFDDLDFAELAGPSRDVESLAGVLGDPAIGAFEVETVVNRPAHEVARKIEEFAADRVRDDLLLLYFSGHGIKDEGGRLHFVMTNTERQFLGATAVAAGFVSETLDRSRSRRNVLMLDCCYSGAFARGMATKGDRSMQISDRFSATGRVVLTASDSMQYAFEGSSKVDGELDGGGSVFTRVLVDGLRSGEADLDGDGVISIGELYDYVYDRVVEEGVHQRPGKWEWGLQGRILVARNPSAHGLPAPLKQALRSPYVGVRVGALDDLELFLASSNRAVASAAEVALVELTDDDSKRVSLAAESLLARHTERGRRDAEEEARGAEEQARRDAEEEARAAEEQARRDAEEEARAAEEQARRDAEEEARAAEEQARRDAEEEARAAEEQARRDAEQKAAPPNQAPPRRLSRRERHAAEIESARRREAEKAAGSSRSAAHPRRETEDHTPPPAGAGVRRLSRRERTAAEIESARRREVERAAGQSRSAAEPGREADDPTAPTTSAQTPKPPVP